jgi:hypothetical protein
LNGQVFTSTGDITNAGKLTLGPASSLYVGGTGNFTQTSKAKLTIQMGGTNSVPTIGSIEATGAVSLAGRLTVTSTVVPSSGTVFTILDNDGPLGVSGTFKNLLEGSTLVANGVTYQISYVGNGAHDVTLTAE